MKKLFAFFALLLPLFVFAGDLPDPHVTPGFANPAVTQDNIDQTICVTGWTKTIRPTVSYTNKLKVEQLSTAPYFSTDEPHKFEEDHLISLELGGNPSDPRNLWPQPWDGEWGARKKDVLETRLKRLVCGHKLTLEQAQQAISSDWKAAYTIYVGEK